MVYRYINPRELLHAPEKPVAQYLTLALFAVPVLAQADSWKCDYAGQLREVDITRSTSYPVPCEAVYRKPSEGMEDQVLWSAENEAGYCEENAKGFVTKLESYG